MLNIIHKKHKDRYRIQFCDEKFYQTHQNLFKLWKTQFVNLSDVDKLLAWVVALTCLRRPNDWFGGKRQTAIRADFNYQHSLTVQQLFKESCIQIPPKISSETNLFTFINNYRIKALPDTCFRSLCFIVDSTYPLLITKGVVEPLELLQIQIKGNRIVALDEDFETWPHRLYSHRDFLGFVLHDLIHADHFFNQTTHRNAQLGFYRFVEKLILDESTQQLMTSEKFKHGFEYIISDMNSHPLHLFQTLHSLVFSTLKNDQHSSKIWLSWILKNQLNEGETTSLLNINSQNFNEEHAHTIELLSQRISLQNT